MTLDEIDDIELLRKAALLVQEDIKKLVRLLAQLKKELSCCHNAIRLQSRRMTAIAGCEPDATWTPGEGRNGVLYGARLPARDG